MHLGEKLFNTYITGSFHFPDLFLFSHIFRGFKRLSLIYTFTFKPNCDSKLEHPDYKKSFKITSYYFYPIYFQYIPLYIYCNIISTHFSSACLSKPSRENLSNIIASITHYTSPSKTIPRLGYFPLISFPNENLHKQIKEASGLRYASLTCRPISPSQHKRK